MREKTNKVILVGVVLENSQVLRENGDFQYKAIKIKTIEDYPQVLEIRFYGDRFNLDDFEGKLVRIQGSLRSWWNLKTNKQYMYVGAYSIVIVEKVEAEHNPSEPIKPSISDATQRVVVSEDDLPF